MLIAQSFPGLFFIYRCVSVYIRSMDQQNFLKMPNSMLSCNERNILKMKNTVPVGWMDGYTSGCWFCHRSKDCSMAKTLPYAGLTFAVGVVIPKNKNSLHSCNIRSDPKIFTASLYPK